MNIIGSSIIDFSALWRIVAVSLVVGAGVVGAFGYILLGISRYQNARGGGHRAGYGLLVALASAFCLAVLLLGLIAMAEK